MERDIGLLCQMTPAGFWLRDNGHTTWLGPIAAGSSAILQNSQCRLSGENSSAVGLGNGLTVRFEMTFSSGFTGTKSLYTWVYGSNYTTNSGWQTMGTWSVTSPPPPSNISMSPTGGTGATQTFRFTATDTNGHRNVEEMQMLFNWAFSGYSACYVCYMRATNSVTLRSDGSDQWLEPVNGVLENAQCSVNPTVSTAGTTGNDFKLDVTIIFKQVFIGKQKVYAAAWDWNILNSGWPQAGEWTGYATSTQLSPTADSVAPGTGTGLSGTFAFVSSSANGASFIAQNEILFGTSPTGTIGVCFVLYQRAEKLLYLMNDSGTGWLASLTVGQAGTRANSQCEIDAGASSVTPTGNYPSGSSLTLNLKVTFTAAFGGSKNVYLTAYDREGRSNALALPGSWTVGTPPAPPPQVTLTAPANGEMNQSPAVSLNWGPASGATSYDVYLSTNSSPSFLATVNSPPYNAGTLNIGTTYYWKVVAKNSGGSAPASAIWTFRTVIPPPDMTIAKTHSGNFTQGQTGAYTITVTNSGAGPSSGAVTVTDTLPTGLTAISMLGTGWTCSQPAGPCSRSNVLPAGTSYPAITLTVNVAPSAPASITNTANVSGGGESNTTNNQATDATTITPEYSDPLAFATTASVRGNVETAFTVTYASGLGRDDIAHGQIKIHNCYLAWDAAGNVVLYSIGPGYADASGTMGQALVLSAGSCSINLANSHISAVAANPKALDVTLALTFPEQNFVGTHEVYAWGTNVRGLTTAQVDLGALVVNEGQDFTLNVTPGSGNSIMVGPGASVNLTMTATGLHGFTGNIPISVFTNGSTCFLLSAIPTTMAANTQATVTIQNQQGFPCVAGATTQLTFHGRVNYSSPNWLERIASSPVLVAGAAGDFTVSVGAPSAPVLSSPGSVNYPVTVRSINNQAGYVNLSLSGLPVGATAQFSPSQVYLNSGGQVSSTLTLTSSASTPGGTFPLVATGMLGSTPRTAAFSLGTQVTAFQVTSSTGSSTVYNTGQPVQITQNVPAGNAPAYQTCTTPDSDVTCWVIASGSGTVTLGVTASTAAAHGTRIFSLNGGAATALVGIGDRGPVLTNIFPSIIQAGQVTPVTISGSGLAPCYIEDICGYPRVILDGPQGPAGWAWVTYASDSSISATLYPPLNAAGHYSVTVDVCGGYWNPADSSSFGCGAGPLGLDVEAPPQPPQSPFAQITKTGTSTVVSGNTQPIVVSVGERIDLTGTVADLPAGVTVSGHSWSVTGDIVKNYTQSLQTAAKTEFSASTAQNPHTNQAVFYWINSDNTTNRQATYTATLSNNATVSAVVLYRVVRPSPAAFSATVATDSPEKPAINATDQGFFTPSIPSLNLGYKETTNPPGGGPVGVDFNINVTATFHGSIALTQLIRFSTTRQNATTTNIVTSTGYVDNKYVLDDKEGIQLGGPQDMQGHDNVQFKLDDTPAVGLPAVLQHVATNQKFKSYLMYKPPSADSIWVTLRILTWEWSAGATKNAAGTWVVDSGASAPAAPASADSIELPVWTNYASNPQQ